MIVFSKISDFRNKHFQISTNIYLSEGTKTVVKQALHQEGILHIQNFEKSYEMLCRYSDLDYPRPVVDGDRVIFEYISGETLKTKILDAARKKDERQLIKCFKLYKKIVTGSERNIVPFVYTADFTNVFGTNIEGLKDIDALHVSDLDINPDNIILHNDVITVIDYEWTMAFPVPLDFILYRNLKEFFFKQAIILNPVISFGKSIGYSGNQYGPGIVIAA